MRKHLACALALFFASAAPAAAVAQTSKFGIPSTSGAGAIAPVVSTFAQLPTCDVSHIGFLRVIVDAAATPVYNATTAGGGSVRLLTMCNGVNWVNQ